MNKKLFTVLILIFLTIFLSGCLPKTQKPSSEAESEVPQQAPSDWLKFTSDDSSFSFSYPPDWELKGPNKGENYYNLSLESFT